MRQLITILTFLLLSTATHAQKGSTLFGFEYKPIVPNRLIGMYEQNFDTLDFQSTVRQKFGNALGMNIRIGLGDRISLETGLGFTQRNYQLDYALPDSGYTGSNDVRVIGYQLPVRCMVFIRLGDAWFMNTSLGAAMTAYPSDVRTHIGLAGNERFQQEGRYNSKIQGAALANIGWEYRSKKNGTFYLGVNYNLPFVPIMAWAMSYESPGASRVKVDYIRGSFLTVDLRYYLPESKKDKDER